MRSTSSHRARLDKIVAARQKARGHLDAVTQADRDIRVGQMYAAWQSGSQQLRTRDAASWRRIERLAEIISAAATRREFAELA
jgi:hypothetical protein